MGARRSTAACLVFLAANTVWLSAPNTLRAQASDLVHPPHSTVEGRTLGEWGAEWWAWVFSIPRPRNPLLVPFDEVAHVGQSGPVFFVTAGAGGRQEFCFEVPEGKPLFIPIVNAVRYNGPGQALTLPEMVQLLKEEMDSTKKLVVEIDGQSLPEAEIFAHRESFAPFRIRLAGRTAVDNLTGDPPGDYGPVAHDGFYLMVKPPSPGPHVIRVAGFLGTDDPRTATFSVDVTHRVDVRPAPSFHFLRGDANLDGRVDITDSISLLEHLFHGGDPRPARMRPTRRTTGKSTWTTRSTS